jgi:hypothetical protein
MIGATTLFIIEKKQEGSDGDESLPLVTSPKNEFTSESTLKESIESRLRLLGERKKILA